MHQDATFSSYEVAFVYFIVFDMLTSVFVGSLRAGKTIKGGTGSGDVNERKSVSIYEGFVAKGVEITDKDWILGYEEIYRQARLVLPP